MPAVMTRLIALCALISAPALAAEGKWTPQQLAELGPVRLKAMGLTLPPERLWNPKTGTGLMAGVVSVDGCSGGFISPQGLFVTNHHCLFSIIQEHATPQRDLLTNGFYAEKPEDELKGKAVRVRVPKSFKDVTKELLASVPEGADDLARFRAMERKQQELVAACERTKGARCSVATFEGGLSFTLVETQELSDVRLVYAPPRGIGELGGEVDNWTWPRHTGDFAIARAYGPDGAPFRSEQYFPLAKSGVKPGDFVMVLGYPGKTFRALTADEMAERQEVFFPAREALNTERIHDLLEAAGKDAAGKIAVAEDVKSLANRQKNAQGQLAGFTRWDIVQKQRAQEEAVVRWAQAQGGALGTQAVAARQALGELVKEQRETWQRDTLLSTLSANGQQPGSKGLIFATVVARAVTQRQLPDLERDPEFMDRNLKRWRDKLERQEKSYYPAADQRLFVSFVRRALALPPGQRIGAVDALFKDVPDAQLPSKVAALYAKSQLLSLPARLAMFDGDLAALVARKDPLVDFGLALDKALEELRARQDRFAGASLRLRPQWRRAVLAHAGKPVAPDANSTLRVSFAHVMGYSPRDGVLYTPQTTLSGLVAKHTDAEPFDVPDRVLAAAASRTGRRWEDPQLKDIPLCFLADADTTGGNSGSPTVNGRGELVGVNFDRVWENVSNDFAYQPAVGRNVNADVRYLLWMLELEGASRLLTELKVPPAPEARR